MGNGVLFEFSSAVSHSVLDDSSGRDVRIYPSKSNPALPSLAFMRNRNIPPSRRSTCSGSYASHTGQHSTACPRVVPWVSNFGTVSVTETVPKLYSA